MMLHSATHISQIPWYEDYMPPLLAFNRSYRDPLSCLRDEDMES